VPLLVEGVPLKHGAGDMVGKDESGNQVSWFSAKEITGWWVEAEVPEMKIRFENAKGETVSKEAEIERLKHPERK
jgi:hypothetical protein